MKIKQIKRNTANFSKFMLREWKLIHPEHYGEELDFSYWHTQHIYFEAIEGKKIIGASSYRGRGIGGSLLKRAENWAKNHHGHEVYLFTGKNWKEKKFYLKVGYQVTADVPRFYSKVDFILMRKFLD